MRPVAATARQTTSAAPRDWDAAVRELVDRVAAIAPPGRIDLTVNNVSSLSADEAATIGERVQAELTKRHFRLSGAQAPDAELTVTISEGTDGYLIVAQVWRGAGEQARQDERVAMVAVSRAAKKAESGGGVSLEATHVWDQPGVILDFALPAAAKGTPPEMIVLERGRLAFYARQQDQWQLSQAVTIQPTRSWLRTDQGHIDISQGLAAGTAGVPGIECKGDFENPQTIHCGFVSQDTQSWIEGDAAVPKELNLGGDAASVGLECDGRPVVLATGKGDWTQADFVQAYEMDATGRSAVLTGSPVAFAGPVTSLWATGASGVARAVVRDLKTGNYEAWVVTASCGR
ncbi:MAG TPA: hypothetical protein VHX36_03340 [Candidatus Acidoferrales bacterium]|nr:hypothetical protein [Candidatus Acidoferrales bacterium]